MATVRADRPGRLGEVFGGGPLSVKVARWSPNCRDARPGRRHRHLGRAAGDERGEDHTDGSSVPTAGVAREQESGGSPDSLGSGRDARVGWLEAEVIRVLDRACSLVQPASQVQEFSCADAGSEAASQAPPGLRGQRSGYEEASPLEVEGWIHAQDLLAHTGRSPTLQPIILAMPSVPRTERRRT